MAENKNLDIMNEYGPEYIMPNEQEAQLKSGFLSGGTISVADILKATSAYIPISSGFGMNSSGVCTWSNPQKPVELYVEQEVFEEWLRSHDANFIDKYIKEELAKKLAQKMIEEDLIKINVDDNPWGELCTKRFSTKVKFIQE